MRTLLICHHDADFDRDGVRRWLGGFSNYVGTVVVQEPHARLRQRIKREIRRVGWWRFADVLAFRLYYKVLQARRDRRWLARQLDGLRRRFPIIPYAPELIVSSPNDGAAECFIRQQEPDLVIARCKTLLKEQVFSIPRLGTFVMHPGICPEYRNAHGCFWALANGEDEKVGMTLLRIDRGVDTGPVFGYFHATPAEGDSHVVLEHRAVLEHFDQIRDTLFAIETGTAVPIDTSGRASAAWGQPWLTAALKTRRRQMSQSRRRVRALST
jgi:hypothetical protein